MYKYSRYDESKVNSRNDNENFIPSLLLTVGLILFVGFRPLSYVFVDMMNYNQNYGIMADESRGFEYDNEAENFIFDNLFQYMATNYYEIAMFFLLIAAIYFSCMFFALKKIFPNDLFYALVVYLGAFSTFSYGTNGIKAGAAASIFLLAFAYYRKPIIAALFMFISLGFHHSMTLPIVAFLLAYFVRNPKWYFAGWVFCLLMSAAHVTAFQEFFADFTDERGQGYLLSSSENDWGGKAGFRWDFILYSLPPIAIGWWAIYKKRVTDRMYQLLLCTYMVVNAVWMLCMYVQFNNRIAYLSWFILPILIIYPFMRFKMDPKQFIQLNYIVGVYLVFTLVIKFIF